MTAKQVSLKSPKADLARSARWLSAAIGFVFLAALLFSPARSAEDDVFSRQQIDVSGIILGERHGDLNGDGLTDIIFIVAEPSGARFINIYLQREMGRFPPMAGQRLPLSKTANQVECRDLNGDRRSDILVVDHEGLWQYSFDGTSFADKPVSLIAEPTIYIGGLEDCLITSPIIYTISGKLHAIMPTANGYSLWEYAIDKFRAGGAIGFTHRMSKESRPAKLFGERMGAIFDMTLPEITVADENGDGKDDLYLVWPDRLLIVRQKSAGGFENPVIYPFARRGHDNLCLARVVDYNKDKRPDLVSARAIGGIAGAHTEISFFGADRIARSDRNDSYHVTLSDACGNLMIDDFDGNGLMELVVPAIELGIMSTVKKMIAKETDLYLLIYPISSSGQIDKEPVIRKKLPCQLNFEKASPTASVRIDWSGDYDGDGLRDLLFADGGDQVLLYRGVSTGYLDTKAILLVDVPSPDHIQAVELNGDSHTDLVVIHTPGETTSRATIMVSNRIN